MSPTERRAKYISDVLGGAKLCSKWERQAVQRHVSGLSKAWRWKFDDDRADRFCNFIELFCHYKGEWASGDKTRDERLIRLEPWQCFVFGALFGWVDKVTSKRRYNKGRLYVPRKNGKSIGGAGVGLYMLAADDEPGAEVYCGATSERQANEVFVPAKQMAAENSEFREFFGVLVNAQSIVLDGSSAKLERIIGKPGDGSSPHCAIIDEYHEHATNVTVSAMETGMGARSQPLSFVISTAGVDIGSPCFEDWQTCEKILAGEIEAERTFCIIYAAEKTDAWDSIEALQKANPNYGVSVSIEFLKNELESARHSPARRAAYETKHLNRWVQTGAGFMNMADWDKCAGTFDRRADHIGRRAWAGVDLAAKVDIASVRYLIELDDGTYATWGRNYLHAEAIARIENEHYRRFVAAGSLTECPGNSTDFEMILEDISADANCFDLQEIGCDPSQAGMFMKRLEAEGFSVVEFPQGAKHMNEPMRTLESDVASGKLIHDDCPMMNWMVANVTVKSLGKYIYPQRSSKSGKIDGFVSLVMARGLSGQDAQEVGHKSIFERGGLG